MSVWRASDVVDSARLAVLRRSRTTGVVDLDDAMGGGESRRSMRGRGRVDNAASGQVDAGEQRQ